MKIRDITSKEVYEFCRSHYYCDDGSKWEPMEDYDDDIIEEWIDNDVLALNNFLGLKRYR